MLILMLMLCPQAVSPGARERARGSQSERGLTFLTRLSILFGLFVWGKIKPRKWPLLLVSTVVLVNLDSKRSERESKKQ